MKMPCVSIIMPAYNVAPWIDKTLHSVLRQTFVNWECLIIDDGSTDDTAECARAFADPRIRIFSQLNKGVSAARNYGLELARGHYIVFLDADDIWASNALELMCSTLDAHPECALAWADFVRFEDVTGRELPLPATRLWHTGDTWVDMLVDNFMQFGALCIRANAVSTLRFDVGLHIGEDRDWLLRLLYTNKAVHIPHVVHFYRQRKDSAVRDIRRFLDDEEVMIRKHLSDPRVLPHVRRRALSALAFHRAVLFAKLGQRTRAMRSYLSALLWDPLYLENYFRPLRKLFFAWFSCRNSIISQINLRNFYL